MTLRMIAPLVLVTAMGLTACNKENDDNKNTTPAASDAVARDFAVSLSGSLAPILEVEEPLENFAMQLAEDSDGLNQEEMDSFAEGLEEVFNDLDYYIDSAITRDIDDNVTDIDWSILPASATLESGITVNYDNNSDVLSVSGSAIVADGSLVNTITTSFSITLPAEEVSNNRVTASINNLNIADSFGNSITATSGSFSLAHEVNSTDLVDFTSADPDTVLIEVSLVDGEIVLGNAITIQGEGSLSINYAENYRNNAPTDYEFELFDVSFDMTGRLMNSNNVAFTATVAGQYDSVEDHSGVSNKTESIQLSVDLDLTDLTSSQTYISAALDFNFSTDYGSDTDSSLSESTIELDAEYHLTVGVETWGFRIAAHYVDQSEVGLVLTDLGNSSQQVTLELLVDSEMDFESSALVIGHIKVNGEEQADVKVDNNTGEIYADFAELDDVQIIPEDVLSSL